MPRIYSAAEIKHHHYNLSFMARGTTHCLSAEMIGQLRGQLKQAYAAAEQATVDAADVRLKNACLQAEIEALKIALKGDVKITIKNDMPYVRFVEETTFGRRPNKGFDSPFNSVVQGVMADWTQADYAAKKHVLKTDGPVFQEVWDGKKLCELRKFDRDFKVGDILSLKETKWTGEHMKRGCPLIYTHRVIRAKVSSIIAGPKYGIEEGWCVMSIKVLHRFADSRKVRDGQ